MPSPNRRVRASLIASTSILAISLSLWLCSYPLFVPPLPAPASAPLSSSPSTPYPPSIGRVELRSPASLTVVDADGRVLPGAETWLLGDPSSHTVKPERTMKSDQDGAIPVDASWLSKDTIVFKDGFLPLTIRWVEIASRTVTLGRGSGLRVRCTHDGRPAQDCRVVVARHPVPAGSQMASGQLGGIVVADPRSTMPVWRTSTDSSGLAAFSLHPGTYLLNVFHDWLYPMHETGIAMQAVAAPGEYVVEMAELWGAVAAIPEGVGVRTCAALVDTRALSYASGVLARRAAATTNLRTRFHSPMAIACLPLAASEADPPIVSFRALAMDGSAWTGRWPLVPISEIEGAVLLDRVDNAGKAEVRIMATMGDRPFSGPVTVRSMDGWPPFDVNDGDVLHLPVGRYVCEAGCGSPWCEDDLLAGAEPLGPGTSTTWHLRIPEELVELVLRPSLANDALDRGAVVSVARDDASLSHIWRASEKGDLRILVPPGTVRVSGHAPDYVPTILDISVAWGSREHVCDLVLQPIAR